MENKKFIDEISGKAVNFLIGSGASAGVVPTLWIESISKSFEEIISSNEYSAKQKDVLYYLWFNLWISKTQITKETEANKDILGNYTEFINSVISFLSNEGYDRHKRVNIFTTNYDTLFELSFDIISQHNRLVYFNDGSRGFFNKYISTEDFYININHSGINDGFQRAVPSINLVKMHGSVTWAREHNKIKVNVNNEIFSNLLEKSSEIDKRIEKLYEIGKVDKDFKNSLLTNNLESYVLMSSFTEEDLINKIDTVLDVLSKEISDFISLYKTLPVVNPTKNKFSETVFDQHYYQMLRLLSFELERKNSVLIVFGFSFADEHILEIVRRSMVNPFLRIYVIGYSQDSLSSLKELLGSENRIEYLPNFKDSEDIIKGDFNYLIKLLLGEEI